MFVCICEIESEMKKWIEDSRRKSTFLPLFWTQSRYKYSLHFHHKKKFVACFRVCSKQDKIEIVTTFCQLFYNKLYNNFS